MACSNCNTPNCGCSGTYVVSQTCPPACSEVFNSSCIVYTGVDITCTNSQTGLSSTVVSRNDYLDTALTSIVNFFCARVNESLTSTVVTTASAPYLAVTSSLVGSVTTFSVDLDIDAVAAAVDGNTTVVEAGGTNVTVDVNPVGSVTTYTVTAQGTDVQSGDDFIDVEITQNGDDDIVTLTLDINEVEDALGEVSVAQGTSDNVTITTVNNFPTAGDTQYRLDVVSTDIQSVEEVPSEGPLITVTPSGGTAPDYDQLFTLQMDVDNLREFIMDTTSGVAPVGGIVGDALSGIDVTYDPVSHTLTIINTAGLPNRWLTLGNNGVDPDISASSPTDILNITGTTGISVSLASAGPNDGTFTIVNTDPGSAQLTFVDVTCSNVSGTPGGTASAGVNGDVLTLVGGTDIDLTVLGNQITIDNLIDRVYSEIQSDAGDTLQAPNTTSTFTIAGGTGIGTIGDSASQTITINNEALVYETITGDTGSTTASGLNDSLAIVSSGAGCSTTVTADTVTIENTGVITVSSGSNIIVDNADPQNPIVSTRANAVLDDSIVSQDVASTGVPVPLTHAVGVQYAQIRVIANTVLTGSFVANQDITSDFAIIMTGVDAYTLESTTYTGNVRVIVVGAV
tara:strand:+ start:24161 stop:26035 length:1875 start_codon:yes stop_codon:yes gene_type:complete